jgi:hypothetical protein
LREKNNMVMKKSILWISASLLLMSFIPSIQSHAATTAKPVSANSVSASDAAEANALFARLDEIKALDKSRMSSSEKKQLRKEVRESRKRINELGSGVYISAGAIIIILLLILLL